MVPGSFSGVGRIVEYPNHQNLLGMIPYIFIMKNAQGLMGLFDDVLFMRSELLLCQSENNQ